MASASLLRSVAELMFHLRTDLKQGFLMKVNQAPGSGIAFTLKVA